MRTITCIVCGAPADYYDLYRLARADSKFRSVLPDLSIYACSSCGTKQVDQRAIDPNALRTYYETSYRTEVAVGVGERENFLRRATAIFETIKPHLSHQSPSLDIFEAGAGYCDNLLVFARNIDTVRLATDEPNAGLVSAEIHYEQLGDRLRDVVILSHVLEHIPDPGRYLAELGTNIAPGGILYIEVPNDVDRGVRFNRLHEPHVTFFDQASLGRLLSETLPDFSIQIIGTAGIHYWQYNPIGLREKLWRKAAIFWAWFRNRLFDGISSRVPSLSIYKTVTQDADRIWLRALLIKRTG